MTIEFLPRDIVEKKITERGAKITTVVFATEAGDIVRRTGLPKVQTRRVGGEKGPAATPESIKRAIAAKKALLKKGSVFFDAPKSSGRGFSFRLDHVVHI